MDRDLVLAILTLALCGPALLTGGFLPPSGETERNAFVLERRQWTRLWLGLLPAALLLAVLLGWAAQEPRECDERVSAAMVFVIAPFGAIWLRALVRGLVALRSRHDSPAATVGLVRPVVVIAPALEEALGPEELFAVRAHEAAHARHRDPLRLWVGQLAADLQWPIPGASRRFRSWRLALEIARDAEARADGADGADLAAAIVVAARLGARRSLTSAALTSGEDIRDRVERLLEPLPPLPVSQRWRVWTALAGLLLLALVIGFAFGEQLIRAMPGIAT